MHIFLRFFRKEHTGDSSDSSEERDVISLGSGGAADAGAEDEAKEEREAEEGESDDENAPAGSETITARAKRLLGELDDAWASRSVPSDALEKAAKALGVSPERAAACCKRHRSAVAKRCSGNAAVGVVTPVLREAVCVCIKCTKQRLVPHELARLQEFTCAQVADPTYHGCNAAAEATADALRGVADGLARRREAALSACLAPAKAAKKPEAARGGFGVPCMPLLDALVEQQKKRDAEIAAADAAGSGDNDAADGGGGGGGAVTAGGSAAVEKRPGAGAKRKRLSRFAYSASDLTS